MVRSGIARLVGRAAQSFYQLDVRGEPLPSGPVMVVANHPNALLDPLIIFRTANRIVRPLAKEPLFHHTLIGPFLRALGGLPVYRKQDHPDLMHQNEQTFAAAIAALKRGDAIQIFPEGQSHSEARLAPLKTGAARIALRAEAEAKWQLGLQIVPIGLTYSRKTFFRGRAVAQVGSRFGIADLRELYERDATAAISEVMARIARALEQLILNLASTEDLALIDTAERLYAREKGLASWREAEGLGDRMPRLQAFARGLAWLRDHDPARHDYLSHSVQRYRRQAELLGAGEADVPPRYGALGVLWYVLREAVVLGLGLPLAAIALVFWYPPYRLNRVIVERMKIDESAVATYKLGIALVLLPLTQLLWVIAAAVLSGWKAAALAAIGLPLLGMVLKSWSARWNKVWQDVRLFFAVLARPRSHSLLREARATLVAQFDAVVASMEKETAP